LAKRETEAEMDLRDKLASRDRATRLILTTVLPRFEDLLGQTETRE